MADTHVPVSDPLLAQAYNQSDAQSFDEVVDRALYLYLVMENSEEALDQEWYDEDLTIPDSCDGGGGEDA